MTPENIELVRASFRMLGPALDEFGPVFYARLFEANPELRTIFPRNMGSQSRALIGMLGLIVKMLDMQEKLRPLIHYLGERHTALSVSPEHYPPFGEALMWALESFLREDFTPATRRAWQEAYQFMADNMQ
jgi:hemoglobin-like flavoprotein